MTHQDWVNLLVALFGLGCILIFIACLAWVLFPRKST